MIAPSVIICFLLGGLITIRDCYYCKNQYLDNSTGFVQRAIHTLAISVIAFMGVLSSFSLLIYTILGKQIPGFNTEIQQIASILGSILLLALSFITIYEKYKEVS